MKNHVVVLLSVLLFPALSFAEGILDLPALPSPEQYGSVRIARASREGNVTPVAFSHWVHRAKYTCSVCHSELEFAMKVNDTPLVCDNGEMKGKFCAVCHDGKVSFGPKGKDGEQCNKCHNAEAGANKEKFAELKQKLPGSKFGNKIDWVKAMNEGLIKPKDSLTGNARIIANDKVITLQAEMRGIPSAIFPHKTHEQWLDCSNCHPDLFNIQKKTTATLRMDNMLKGESCAVCHLRVAFPLDDCKRCHPTITDISAY